MRNWGTIGWEDRREAILSSLSNFTRAIYQLDLKLKLDPQTQRRRILEDRALPVERIGELNRSGPGDPTVSSQGFVLSDRALLVSDVEPVKLNTQLPTLTQFDRIVGAEIQVVSRGRPSSPSKRINGCSSRNVKTFVVAVYRMRNQGAERYT